MYDVKRQKTSIDVETYLKEYVDVDKFIRCCEECPNHNSVWTCPPFEFDAMELWQRYDILDLYAEEIIFDKEYAGRKCSKDELQVIMERSLGTVSMALSAGSCRVCGECTRPTGEKCRNPEKARYSIESIGGDVGKTINELMRIELEWMEEDVLPGKFVLVCGLLRKGMIE